MWFVFKIIQTVCNPVWAQEGGGGGGSSGPHALWAIGATYDYHLTNNLRGFTYGASAGGDPSAASGSFTGMRTFATLWHRPFPGVEVGILVGSAYASTLTLTGTSVQYGTITETFSFDAATMYGGQIRVNLFPSWRFHIVPSMSWRSASYSGSGGSLSNSGGTVGSACSYDFSTNSASACRTIGLTTGGGIASPRFFQTYYSAALEASVDIGSNASNPWLIIHAGVEQGISTVTGTVTFTPPSGTAVSEQVGFSNLRTEHVFAGLGTTIDRVRIRTQAQFLGDLSFTGQVSVVF